MRKRAAFQGVPGAFSHEAAMACLPGLDLIAFESFDQVFAAVESGDCAIGFVPVENSTAGPVPEVNRLLETTPLQTVGEHRWRVRLQLMAPPGANLEGIRTAESHHMALAQCPRSLAGMGIEAKVAFDTAGAARDVALAGDVTRAAVASRAAADLYGLVILKEAIEDSSLNTTRFVVLRPEGADRADLDTPLANLRTEIDRIDERILDMLEERMDLASRIGALKGAPTGGDQAQDGRVLGGGVRLRPDRESAVVQRLLGRAQPEVRPLALAVWREIMGEGLARQGRPLILVWPATAMPAARRRFGAAPDYQTAADAEDALSEADFGAIAVLGLEGPSWWADLRERRPNLWVCEAFDGPQGSRHPCALAVARIPPDALAPGRLVTVSPDGPDDATTLTHGGGSALHLNLTLDGSVVDETQRGEGVIGRVPPFCFDAEEAAG